MTKNDELSRLKELAATLAQRTSDEICEREDLGGLKFTDLNQIVDAAIQSARTISESVRPGTPNDVLSDTSSCLENINGQIGQLDGFKVTNAANLTERWRQVQMAVQQNIKPPLEALRSKHVSAIGYYGLRYDFQSLRKELNLEDYIVRVDESRNKIESILEDSERIRDSIKAVSAESGAEKHSANFHNLALIHESAATTWLFAFIAVLIIAIALPVWVLDKLIQIDGNASSFSLFDARVFTTIVTRLVVISLSYLAVVWTMRNYRAHRHLAVINSQKSEALKTFRTFVDGAEDSDTKNAVLLETTRAIFAQGVTGYLGPNEEIPNSPITEITRILGSGKGP